MTSRALMNLLVLAALLAPDTEGPAPQRKPKRTEGAEAEEAKVEVRRKDKALRKKERAKRRKKGHR